MTTDAPADWSQRADDLYRASLREQHDQVCDGDACHHYQPEED